MRLKTNRLSFFNLAILLLLLAHPLAGTPGRFHLAAMTQPLINGKNHPPFSVKDASHFPAKVPLAWFNLAYDLVRDEALSPPVAARAFGYQSLAGQLNDLPPLPKPSDKAYHWPAVANSALAATLRAILPGASSATQASIQALESQFVAQFQPALPPGIFQRSVDRGRSISQAIQRWAKSDGALNYSTCPFLPPGGAGLWVPTPPGFKPPLLPCWGQLRPFVLAEGSQCSPGPPPAYSEDPGSDFYREAWEVYTVVNQLTAEQLAIAQFWADDPGRTGTPPGHSISILNQILVQQEASLETAAEACARLGIALADSFIACWWTKYQHNLLRPITYIHTVLGDTSWSTPVNTPPFPEYTSGHSVQSAAAAQVLTDLFGAQPFTDQTHAALGYAPRTFTDFFAFAEEAAISRLYGGIHFRAAIERCLEQGRCVGQRVSALKFRIQQ